MERETPLSVAFYCSTSGREPVREWLKSLPSGDRKIIGEDIKTVQFGFPLGMPLVRKLKLKPWEVRSVLPDRCCPIASRGFYLRFMIIAWCFFMDSSKNPRKHPLMI